ncbi:MAG: FHA domain-containing protein [Kiritimatiellae bacterium]|nr:FHA domain-containing protein [Kiritimatiellia bacterium]
MLLVYAKKDGATARIRLKTISRATPITIGRDKNADITLDDPECSRIHTAIRYWDDIFVVRDMGSSNGTVLNGKKIDVAQLNPGDVIKIGETELKATAEQVGSDVTARLQYSPES